mgnify:CR=1 FL=1|tara:strand:- start:58130 stop:58468 length:339 start_codon:yes stop_codon:yes gene_type:complete
MIRSVTKEEQEHDKERYDAWWDALGYDAKSKIIGFCETVLGINNSFSNIKVATEEMAASLTWPEVELKRYPSLGAGCHCSSCSWKGILAGLPIIGNTVKRCCPKCFSDVIEE